MDGLDATLQAVEAHHLPSGVCAQSNLSGATATNATLRARLTSATDTNRYLQERLDEEIVARRRDQAEARAREQSHVKAASALRSQIDELETQLATRVDQAAAHQLEAGIRHREKLADQREAELDRRALELFEQRVKLEQEQKAIVDGDTGVKVLHQQLDAMRAAKDDAILAVRTATMPC